MALEPDPQICTYSLVCPKLKYFEGFFTISFVSEYQVCHCRLIRQRHDCLDLTSCADNLCTINRKAFAILWHFIDYLYTLVGKTGQSTFYGKKNQTNSK